MNHVLIVDDKEENLYLLKTLFSGNGWQADTARHGAEALHKARQSLPDLIVTDLLMPVMDGYTLLRHWKSDETFKRVPFVVYTATYTEPSDEELALSLGADAFILKPTEPEELLCKFNDILAKRGSESTVPVMKPSEDENALLKVYSETLIRKLEEKMLQLEAANKALENDIAARKIVEHNLRESEQRFRELAENINEVFWITEVDKSRALYVSPAFAQIWGHPCESLYQNPNLWLECIHPEDRERVAEAARTRQAAGGYDETYRIVRPDGLLRWIHDRAFPVVNQQGECYRIVGTAEDITEKKRLEAQFLRAQRMESIGTLAGGIAHDLNNVLAPILMSVQLLQLKITDREGASLLSTLESCAQRGADLVRQVLTFARGIDGKRVSVDLCHMTREIQKIITETFPKSINLHLSLEREIWTVLGDPTQIHQVLMNLCVNARDAMPSGGNITLGVENVLLDDVYAGMNPESKPGRYVMIKIADTGSGIPTEIREKIFEPFFTTKEVGRGTGLGLSTTSAIVRSHGGFIHLYSELNQGSVFKVYLPAEAGAYKEGFSASPESNNLPHGRGEGVLVVDDEFNIRNVTQRTLERFGYKVFLAPNGAEGVAVYVQNQAEIKVVLTDMAMPIMDGPALIAALKTLNPDVRIIASSGLSSEGNIAEAVSAGVRDFVPKPYTAESLLKTLQRVLHRPIEE